MGVGAVVWVWMYVGVGGREGVSERETERQTYQLLCECGCIQGSERERSSGGHVGMDVCRRGEQGGREKRRREKRRACTRERM